MLVDELEDRLEAVKYYEAGKLEFKFVDDQPVVEVDDASYEVVPEAFDNFLNLLRIPIKYLERCLEKQATGLAAENINFWVSDKPSMSVLLENQKVTQIFDDKRLYVPGVRINDAIIDLLGDVEVIEYSVERDLFHAIYLKRERTVYKGSEISTGIRAMFSDCFNVTPRFDGVIYDHTLGIMYCWPVEGRKFRAASTTISQVVDQVEDFVLLVLAQMKDNLLPHINEWSADKIDADDYVHRLSSELRLNRKQEQELIESLPVEKYMTLEKIIKAVSSHSVRNAGMGNISVGDAREIQVALTTYVVKGEYK